MVRTSPRSRRSAPTHAEALPADRRRDPSKPDMFEEHGDNTDSAPTAQEATQNLPEGAGKPNARGAVA